MQGPAGSDSKGLFETEALDQCQVWLSKNCPDADLVPYASTAAAVELAYLADPIDGIAAVGSSQAGEYYGWAPRFEGIESKSENVTRFLILSRAETEPTGNDKTSVMFTCADRPGSLVDILGVFKRNSINLSHIEKRPSQEFGSEYTFFVDMQGHARNAHTAEILGEIRAHCKSLYVLGSFPVYKEHARYQPEPLFTPASSLDELLQESKSVDAQLIELINERAKLVVQVGEFKRKSDVPIYAPHREHAVLNKIQNLHRGPLSAKTLEAIYRELMSGSFRLEKPLRGRVILYDDDHFYLGGVLAEMLAQNGCEVTLVTPAPMISYWTQFTLEQSRIQARLMKMGVNLLPQTLLVEIKPGSVALTHSLTGEPTQPPA